jgi:hypothetical protein
MGALRAWPDLREMVEAIPTFVNFRVGHKFKFPTVQPRPAATCESQPSQFTAYGNYPTLRFHSRLPKFTCAYALASVFDGCSLLRCAKYSYMR